MYLLKSNCAVLMCFHACDETAGFDWKLQLISVMCVYLTTLSFVLHLQTYLQTILNYDQCFSEDPSNTAHCESNHQFDKDLEIEASVPSDS